MRMRMRMNEDEELPGGVVYNCTAIDSVAIASLVEGLGGEFLQRFGGGCGLSEDGNGDEESIGIEDKS